jgi:hypothetical protein
LDRALVLLGLVARTIARRIPTERRARGVRRTRLCASDVRVLRASAWQLVVVMNKMDDPTVEWSQARRLECGRKGAIASTRVLAVARVRNGLKNAAISSLRS